MTNPWHKEPVADKTSNIDFFQWFTHKENLLVCAMAIIIFSIHLLNISNPPYKIGDEPGYVNDANRILTGQPMLFYEHPPLGKLFIAAGISIFGNNAVGWRIFPIIFGTASIFIFYLICVQLVNHSGIALKVKNNTTLKWSQPVIFIPLLATFLFAFENLSFVISHVAMLDVFYVTFMLLGFLFYLKKDFILCGIAVGLSLLCKETAIFGVIVIIVHYIITTYKSILEDLKYTWQTITTRQEPELKKSPILTVSTIPFIMSAMWVLLLRLLEWTTTPLWDNIFTRNWYIIWVNLSLSGSGQGRGLNIPVNPWSLVFQQQLQNFNFTSISPRYIDAISFSLWVLLIPAIIFLFHQIFKNRKYNGNNSIELFAFCWFVPIYGLFIAIDVFIKRPMYAFYFYPCIPAVCLTVALGSWQLWDKARIYKKVKIVFITILILLLFASIVSFVILSPIGSNFIKLPVSI
jgi:predicted membrane-bound dolichyl-phosphate-mannose-protein mannosyltransferase